MDNFQSKIAGEMIVSPQIFSRIQAQITTLPAFKEEINVVLAKSASQLSEVIMAGAINLNVSDIHLEPQEDTAKMRVRIDGTLQDVTDFDFKAYQSLLSRIKLLSGLKLNVANRPQDGRFSVVLPNLSIEVRTSSLPAESGESLVLRVLNPKNLVSIEGLGMRQDLLEVVKKEIRKPNGMIIITGPTGSGKTTTLYAILKQIQRPEVKIITLEDPVEYHLKGISQTQVDPEKSYDVINPGTFAQAKSPGYNFANGLKAIMRQDPEVILVGEIRDLETASIGLQAALTGHLVLTTLHTNDSTGTVSRLQALGEKPANIAPALNMAIAQRLVRKICPKCREMIAPSDEDKAKIKNALKGVPKDIASYQTNFRIPRAVGCKECNLTGFKERVGLFEAFIVNDEMERFILSAPSISSLREKVISEGMITLYQDGIIKALNGLTTIEEVEKVAGEQE